MNFTNFISCSAGCNRYLSGKKGICAEYLDFVMNRQMAMRSLYDKKASYVR